MTTSTSSLKKLIYHAGASANIDRIERENTALLDAGWTLTFDWTVPVRKAGTGSPDNLEIRREAALADLEAVERAHVMWLAQPDASSTSTGAWVELGATLERQRIYNMILKSKLVMIEGGLALMERLSLEPVVTVVSGSSMKCIFSDLADYRFQSHDDALDFIVKTLGRESRS
jgi:hypothetical protein